jgi:hypothetical protein
MSKETSTCCNAPVTKEWHMNRLGVFAQRLFCTKCGRPCDVSTAPSDGAEEGK